MDSQLELASRLSVNDQRVRTVTEGGMHVARVLQLRAARPGQFTVTETVFVAERPSGAVTVTFTAYVPATAYT